MPSDRVVDVQQLVDANRLSPFQMLIIVLCFLIVAVDGFDTAVVGFIAPAIRAEWRASPAQLAPLFGAGLLGLMVGALAIGPFADQWGRKPVLVLSVLFFGAASFASAFAADLTELVAWRFAVGLGLGAAMPSAITLTSEYCPSDRRSLLVTTMFCGFTLGSALGGLVAAQIVAGYGWRSVLLVGGLGPVLLALVLTAALPESVRYLVMRGADPAGVAAILRRIAPQADLAGAVFVGPAKPHGLPVRQLFERDLVAGTLFLWLTCFMSLLVYYLLSNWLPTFVSSRGATLESAARVTALLQVGGTLGAIAIGRLMDRFDPHRVLGATYLAGAAFVTLVGRASDPLWLLGAAVFGAGACIAGSQTGLNALSAAFYPTASRATGVAWTNAIGRGGSVLGSMVGGALLSLNWGFETIFAVAALPAAIAAAAVWSKGGSSRRRRGLPDGAALIEPKPNAAGGA